MRTRHTDRLRSRKEIKRPTRSIAQVVGIASGAILVVLGALAMIVGGVDGIFTPHAEFAGLHHTPLLAGLHILAGIILIATGADATAAKRGGMIVMGSIMTAFGIVVVFAHAQLHDTLATHMAHGVLYALIGLAVLLTAMFAPDVRGGSREEFADEEQETGA